MFPIIGQTHDLGDGFHVTRLLPQVRPRSIGPFVFFDYFGPVDFAPGRGIDVRPHPHIGLATITYLFDGSMVHRDTLGSFAQIKPGDVNWMTAGRGIAHSERTGPNTRAAGHRLHGIQSWVGLPLADEETLPNFQHFDNAQLPQKTEKNVILRQIAGEAFGLRSPVKTFSPILYAEARFNAGGTLIFDSEHEERAFLIIDGEIEIRGIHSGVEIHGPGAMLALEAKEEVTLYAPSSAKVMLLGGKPLEGVRHLWWNFVASSKARIEQAKQTWKEGKFGLIPGDEKEFIPLPEP